MKLNHYLAILFLALLVPSGIKCFTGGVSYLPEERPHLLEGFTADNVAILQLSKAKKDADGKPVLGQDGKPAHDQIVFQRQDKDWVIVSGDFQGALKARASDIKSRILDHLGKIEVTTSSVVAQEANAEQLGKWKLSDEEALRIVCADAAQKEIADLLVGRAAGGTEAGENATRGTYVRRSGQKLVVLCDDDLQLEVTEDHWVNKTLQDIDQAEITAVRLSNEKGQVSFKKEKDAKEWTVVKGPEGVTKHKEDEVTSLVGRARYVNAQSIVPRKDYPGLKHGLEPPRIEVAVTDKDGKEHVLRIGAKVEGKQESYALLSGQQFFFTLADWDVTYFEKDPKDFFDKPPEEKKPEEKKPEEKPGEKQEGAPAKEGDKPPAEAPKPDAPAKSDNPPPAEQPKPEEKKNDSSSESPAKKPEESGKPPTESKSGDAK